MKANETIRRPRVGKIPVWLLGLLLVLGVFVAFPLLAGPPASATPGFLAALALLHGVCLFLAGLGRRYLAWIAFCLAGLLTFCFLAYGFATFAEWSDTTAAIAEEPENLAYFLGEYERLRATYQDSDDPDERRAVELLLPEEVEKAERESAERSQRLNAQARTQLLSLVVLALLTPVIPFSMVGYYRLYLHARRGSARASARAEAAPDLP